MEPSIKRCTLALIMCGISAIGMAQEKLIDEDFSNLTSPPSTWTTLYSSIVAKINGKDVYALKIEKNSSNGIKKGYATTPALNYNGDIILSFKYGKTTNNNSQLTISTNDESFFSDTNKTSKSITISKHINSGLDSTICLIKGVTVSTTIKFALNSDNYLAIDDVVVTKDILCDNADNQYYLTAHNDKETVVHTKRTLTGGIWNTLCLPFDVTKATMEAALGQDVQLRTYTGFAGNVMTFSEVTGDDVITAGTPFLLKLNTTVTNPTFNSVTVSNTAAKTVTHEGVSFIGTYSQKQLATDGTELFITTTGGLAIPTTTGNVMNGMRAYIKVPSNMAFTPGGVRLAIDNETTSIQSVTTTSQPDAVYNLSGQRLQQPRKGLNIVRKNRKLIFIR